MVDHKWAVPSADALANIEGSGGPLWFPFACIKACSLLKGAARYGDCQQARAMGNVEPPVILITYG